MSCCSLFRSPPTLKQLIFLLIINNVCLTKVSKSRTNTWIVCKINVGIGSTWLKVKVICWALLLANLVFKSIEDRIDIESIDRCGFEGQLSVQFFGKCIAIVFSHWLVATAYAYALTHLTLAYGSLINDAKVSFFLGHEMSDQVLAKHVFLSSVQYNLFAKILERDVLAHQLFDVLFKSQIWYFYQSTTSRLAALLSFLDSCWPYSYFVVRMSGLNHVCMA